jgi:hypothetical protein
MRQRTALNVLFDHLLVSFNMRQLGDLLRSGFRLTAMPQLCNMKGNQPDSVSRKRIGDLLFNVTALVRWRDLKWKIKTRIP